jgi:hypothetical protein
LCQGAAQGEHGGEGNGDRMSKAALEIKQKPDDPFPTVARAIAKGKPPKWLPLGLEQFSEFVGTNRVSSKDYKSIKWTFERMHYSADYLIKHLPVHLPGIGRDLDAASAVAVLTKIRASLGRVVKPGRGGGPRPHAQRQVCAAVVVELWKSVHGNVEPRSIELLNACNDYWRACGHEDRGQDVENWRRDVEHAIAKPQEWIRQVLAKVRAVHN